jgi:hypothetical protein
MASVIVVAQGETVTSRAQPPPAPTVFLKSLQLNDLCVRHRLSFRKQANFALCV